MSAGMLSLQNCPRSTEELKGLVRGVRYRLAMQLGMFADDSQEQAFNGATDDQQCEALAAALAQYDQSKPEQQMQFQPPQQSGPPMPPQQQQQQMQPPSPQMGVPQFAPPQVPQQQQQVQPPQQVQPQFQPQFPAPPQPQMQQPQFQPSMGAPQQPMQPPMGMPPSIQPPQAPQPPQPPSQSGRQPPQPQPPMQPQQAQQPPAPVRAPERQPSTPTDPGNQGGAALTILRTMADTLSKLAKANGENQKLIEKLHDQSLGHAKMFEILLTMLLVDAGQKGITPDMLAKLCKQVTDDQRTEFLNKLDPQGKG